MDFETLAQRRDSALDLVKASLMPKLNRTLTKNYAEFLEKDDCHICRILGETQPSPMPWGVSYNLKH